MKSKRVSPYTLPAQVLVSASGNQFASAASNYYYYNLDGTLQTVPYVAVDNLDFLQMNNDLPGTYCTFLP